jgi:4-hydroxy-2-oxoheptanedioate aldolase
LNDNAAKSCGIDGHCAPIQSPTSAWRGDISAFLSSCLRAYRDCILPHRAAEKRLQDTAERQNKIGRFIIMLKKFGTKDLSKLNRPVLGIYVGMIDTQLISMISNVGFDYIRIDMEHFMYGYERAGDVIRYARALGLEVQVRTFNMSDITKLMDAGATGIILPDVDSSEKVKELIGLTKFAPLGHRGMFPIANDVKFGLESYSCYMETANERVLNGVQLENIHVLDHIEEIIAHDGLDFVSSGKADLSQSMGLACQMSNPKVIESENFIIKKALEFGKEPTLIASSRERIKEVWDMGVRIITIGNDTQMIAKMLKDSVDHCFD